MNKAYALRVFAFAALFSLAQGVAAGAPHPEMLVSTEWLAGHGNGPNLVLLHVGRDRKVYDEGHIPGARFVSWTELVITRDGVPNELPPIPDLVRAFERLGVAPDSRIVLYGEGPGPYAARVFFTLDYLGLGERTALLDGGLEKWRAEQRPLSQTEPPQKPGRLEPRVRQDALIEIDAVRRALAAPDAVVIDVRAPADYAVAHLPGARNLPGRDLLAGAVLRSPEEMLELWRAAGLAPGKTAIVYCNTGMMAALSYFTLRYLGHPVRLYDGSLLEWNRVEKGVPSN